MTTDPPIVAARRDRLREWIATHFDGVQASFVAATGINQGELSLLLKNKSFGEKRAASIEQMAGMPAGYLVSPLTDPAPAPAPAPVSPPETGPAAATDHLAGLARMLAQTPDELRPAVGKLLESLALSPDSQKVQNSLAAILKSGGDT